MKAILEFDLPEDNIEFELANNARKYSIVLWELDQWLRSKIKYSPDTMSDDTYNAYVACREELRELMNNEGINFN